MTNKRLSFGLTALVAILGIAFLSAVCAAQEEEVLYSFIPDGQGGAVPTGSLVFDAAGNLYGATLQYGAHAYGTVFELTPKVGGGRAEKVLYNFSGVDGWRPNGGLIFDAAGNLYGTTRQGGSGLCYDNNRIPTGCGTIFELSPQSGGTWALTTLHNFQNNGTDGVGPQAGLIFDHAGNLYGTTYEGGTACYTVGCGTVFELSPASGGGWTEKILHSFSGKNGAAPYDSLIFDSAGNLYGTTLGGGDYRAGTVFELMPNAASWSEKVLYSFSTGTDDEGAAFPYASVIFDSAGNLYGTTFNGGPSNVFGGAVFELSPSGGNWTATVLQYFDTRSSGQQPTAGLVIDSIGDLYGTTSYGGANNGGTAYALRHTAGGSWTLAVLHSFGGTGTDGIEPTGVLSWTPPETSMA